MLENLIFFYFLGNQTSQEEELEYEKKLENQILERKKCSNRIKEIVGVTCVPGL
jgi:hypothetical protein